MSLKRWHDYAFFDSFSNLGLNQIAYGAGCATNVAALARFLARVQGVGIRSWSYEVVTQFAYARFVLPDLRGESLEPA